MTRLVCPCCSQKYTVDFEIVDGLHFFCEKCGNKHVFSAGRLVPCCTELPNGGSRKVSCPNCGGRILLFEEAAGEYACPHCGDAFYVLPAAGETSAEPSEECGSPVRQTPVAPPVPVAPPASLAPPDVQAPRPVAPPAPFDRKDGK